METAVTTLIKDQLQKAIRALYGVELDAIEVEHPQNPAWGDYASNVALINAKQLGKAAPVLAEELIAYLTKTLPKETFNSVSAAGPGFINFTLTRSFYLQKMFRVLTEKSDFGRTDLGHGKRVTLEHSNVNPNKAAHIGHMRNAVIGQFLERAYKFIGYDVTVQYYANDLGVQVSTSLLGVKKLADKYNEKNYRKFDHYMWDIYAKISSLLENDPALKQELAKQMLKLEEREPQISKEQDLLAKKVLQDNLQTFASLDIDYDLIIFESCIKDMKMWEKTFEQLKGNENIYLATTGASQGCWLLRMAGKEGSPGIEKDKIIVRANGIPTYTAKDIAYHMWKFGLLAEDFEYKISSLGQQSRPLYETSIQGNVEKAFTPSELVLDVIDVRQTYAIDAVRAALVYLGYDQQAANLIHINYGHVYLSKDTATKLGYESAENTGQIAMSGRKG
ncbi:arginine--tRNA ligase, partial [Patescibacteria group bacterium]|nr:arginine--tRNA ligase [Patescibacteria group bacterium]MBU1970459.1 arginine--tRNA ligase [Patescibacteria group bacterium]